MIVRNASGGPLERPEDITWPAKDTSLASALDTSYRLLDGAVVDLSLNNDAETLSDDAALQALISAGSLVRVVDGVDVGSSVPMGVVDGWADYNHGGGAVTLTANTWTTIANDGSGAYTNTAYLPPGVSQLMDTSTGEVDFSELALGDRVTIRQDIAITPVINGGKVEMRIQLGTAPSGTYYLEIADKTLDQGAGIEYSMVRLAAVYMGDTNTLGGAGVLQVKSSVAASMTNRGSAILVDRRQR